MAQIHCFPYFHAKHVNTLCGQNAEFWNVKTGATSSNRWALKINGVNSDVKLLPRTRPRYDQENH
jgi:hypothetical protein